MAGSRLDPVRLTFAKEQETKNKWRFQEMDPPEDGDEESKPAQPTARDRAVIEKIYLSKSFLKKRDYPSTVFITIEFQP